MKHLGRMVILLGFFLLWPIESRAQQASRGFVALPDSNWILLTAKGQKDSIEKVAKNLFAVPTGEQSLKILFLNDKRWNNWAIDTTLHISAADTLFLRPLSRAKRATVSFEMIPLHFEREKPRFLKRSLKPGLAALAVLSNWTSFYLKRKADDSYRDYQRSSDLHKINYYYRRTRTFDTLSNVMLGISVSAVTTFLYLLMSEGG